MDNSTFKTLNRIFIVLGILIFLVVSAGIYGSVREGTSVLGNRPVEKFLNFIPLIVLILGIILIVKRRKRIEKKATGKVSDFDFLPTFLLCFFGGFLGLHRFYVERYRSGFFMLITLGLCGVWWLIDFVAILAGEFCDDDGNVIKYQREKVTQSQDNSRTFSKASELKKLADLKKEGILSENEFHEQKKKLLND